MDNLDKLGILVESVSPDYIGSSYCNTVSENESNDVQGSLVKWENVDKKEIVWMLTNNRHMGVVVHSDNLVKVGTVTNLKDYKLSPFVGTVNIHSTAKE